MAVATRWRDTGNRRHRMASLRAVVRGSAEFDDGRGPAGDGGLHGQGRWQLLPLVADGGKGRPHVVGNREVASRHRDSNGAPGAACEPQRASSCMAPDVSTLRRVAASDLSEAPVGKGEPAAAGIRKRESIGPCSVLRHRTVGERANCSIRQSEVFYAEDTNALTSWSCKDLYGF